MYPCNCIFLGLGRLFIVTDVDAVKRNPCTFLNVQCVIVNQAIVKVANSAKALNATEAIKL